MKEIKIFIASNKELQEDRVIIKDVILSLNMENIILIEI